MAVIQDMTETHVKKKIPDTTTTKTKNPEDFLATGWAQELRGEFSKPYMHNLRSFLKSEIQKHHTFYPAKENIFRALKLVDIAQVRVVIIGQDPYHGAGQANGLSFAVNSLVSPPPSLINIFKEIVHNYPPPKNYKFDTSLLGLAAQGVLCLNAVLTVQANKPFSHRNQGWEIFTDKVIEVLNIQKTPIVFLCWGSAAQQKASKITNSHHKILKAPHPSPLSAHRGFLGCKHFILANEFLKKAGLREINWLQTSNN